MSRHDISRDELRRQARAFGATAGRDVHAAQRVYTQLFDDTVPATSRRESLFGRRDMLRIGGFGVATATVISACGSYERGQVGRVGEAPTTTKLPDAVVSDVTLLRTASSLEHTVINVYSKVIGNKDLLDPKFDELAKRFMDDHIAHAQLFEKLTEDAGGTAWTCSNPKIDDVIVNPILKRITQGAEATATAKAIAASDDMHRDVLNFAHGLESIAGSTYQALVGLFAQPSLRADAMSIGVREARHAALLALTVNAARPDGWVNLADANSAEPAAPPITVAPTTTVQDIATPAGGTKPAPAPPQTEIPTVTALPSKFGNLSPIQLVVGKGDENGTRLKINLDTPGPNSFVFEYMTPSC